MSATNSTDAADIRLITDALFREERSVRLLASQIRAKAEHVGGRSGGPFEDQRLAMFALADALQNAADRYDHVTEKNVRRLISIAKSGGSA